MGQAEFPLGLSKEFPPEESPVGERIMSLIKSISDRFGADEDKREDTPDEF